MSIFECLYLFILILQLWEYLLICPEGGSVISTAFESMVARELAFLLSLMVLYCYLSAYLKHSTNTADFISLLLYTTCVTRLVYIYVIVMILIKYNVATQKQGQGKQTSYLCLSMPIY